MFHFLNFPAYFLLTILTPSSRPACKSFQKTSNSLPFTGQNGHRHVHKSLLFFAIIIWFSSPCHMLNVASLGHTQTYKIPGPNAKINLVTLTMHCIELTIETALSGPPEWQGPMQPHKVQKPCTGNEDREHSPLQISMQQIFSELHPQFQRRLFPPN